MGRCRGDNRELHTSADIVAMVALRFAVSTKPGSPRRPRLPY
jgi:hypothetical protein